MVYGYSNYTNSVNSYNRYNYNTTRNSYSEANTAGAGSVSPTYKNSYVNSDAIKTLTNIRNNASALMDSLDVMTQATTFSKMYAENSKAENTSVKSDSPQDTAYRDTRVEAEQTATSARVNEDTQANANQSAIAHVNRSAQNNARQGANVNRDSQANAKQSAISRANESMQARTRQTADNAGENTKTNTRQTAVGKNAAKPTADAAKNLVSSFNGLIKAAKSNSRLTGDLTDTYATQASSLKNLGITSKSDGTLDIDADKLDKAASDGSLESFFTTRDGNNSGFTQRLSRIASTAEKGGYGAVSPSSSSSSSAYAQNLANINGYGRNSYNSLYNNMFSTSGGNTLGVLLNLYA